MAIETTYFGLTNIDISFWSMVGTWLASAGTLAAVMISLYIAINSNKLKLKINSNTSHFPQADGTINFEDIYFSIEAINICDRTITIENIYFELPDQSSIVFPYYNNPYSTKLPKKLEHSEKISFFISFLKNKDWIEDYLKILKEKNLNFDKWKISIQISTGYKFRSKMHPNIIKKLEELKEIS
ncbi:hypothetical protein ACL9Z5_002492 [Acinetobacter calcoaceticus]